MSIQTPPVAPQWSFYLSEPTGPNIGSLQAATARKLTFYLDQAATVGWTMPGDHPETALVAETATDLVASRNGVNLFRGRVGNSTDTLTAETIVTAFAALDYRGMLGRRLMWSSVTRSFRGADQADIAWQMISDTQALPGGGLGIVRGAAAATGTLRDRDYDPGKNLGQALDELGQVDGGFNWEIDANRNFNLFYPARGRQTGLVLTYGRDVVALTRTLDATTFANAIRFNGSSTTTADEVAVSTFDPQIGRWDGQRSDPNVVLQTTVDERSAYELANASVLSPAYQVTMAAGRWDPAEIWVGDTVTLIVDDGRLDVNTAQRIVQIDVTLTDDGAETVVLSVQAAPAALTTRLVAYNSRLNNLERALSYIPDIPVGSMYDWPGTTPPQLTMWCDGSILNIAQYPDLHAVLGATYGGDGVTTFAIPDCRGRMTVAAGAGTGLTARTAGQTGGAETVALTGPMNGSHGHRLSSVTTSGPTTTHTHGIHLTGTTNLESPAHAHAINLTANSNTESTGHSHALDWQYSSSAAAGNSAVAFTSGQSSTQGENNSHTHTVPINGNSATSSHQHVMPISGASDGDSANSHAHVINTTTDDGSPANQGVAHQNMPPWIAIGKVIRVLSPQNQ